MMLIVKGKHSVEKGAVSPLLEPSVKRMQIANPMSVASAPLAAKLFVKADNNNPVTKAPKRHGTKVLVEAEKRFVKKASGPSVLVKKFPRKRFVTAKTTIAMAKWTMFPKVVKIPGLAKTARVAPVTRVL